MFTVFPKHLATYTIISGFGEKSTIVPTPSDDGPQKKARRHWDKVGVKVLLSDECGHG